MRQQFLNVNNATTSRKPADAVTEIQELASAVSLSRTGMMLERHYSPEELGTIWGLSADTMRRLFEHEAGVLVIERRLCPSRLYRTLRIPESVAVRVHRRLTNPVDKRKL
jgi:hypothetical protein